MFVINSLTHFLPSVWEMLCSFFRKQVSSLARSRVLNRYPMMAICSTDWITIDLMNRSFTTTNPILNRKVRTPLPKSNSTSHSGLRYQPDDLSLDDACKLLNSRELSFAEVTFPSIVNL